MIRIPSRYAAGALAVAGLALAPFSAQATEGPATEGPPAAPAPSLLAPISINVPSPAVIFPARHVAHVRSRVLRAKLAPRRVHRGRASRLHLAISTPGRVRVELTRHAGKRLVHVATLTLAAPARTVSLKMPARLNGKPLAAGRYRVTVVTSSRAGGRSRPVRRALTVVGH